MNIELLLNRYFDDCKVYRLFYILIPIALSSCTEPTDVGEISNDAFVYQNDLTLPLKIINYRGGKIFERTILASRSLNQEVSTIKMPDGSIIYNSDSVKVIFGDEKYNIFNRSINSKYNFLDDKNLTTTFPKNNYTEKKYIFTSQDLNDAISCNGNCE